MLAKGMKVVLADNSTEELNETAAQLRKESGRDEDVVAVTVDVASPESLKKLHEAVDKAFGKDIALLWNNAGIGLGGGVLAPRDRWNKVIDVNGWGPINGTQEFLPAMLAQGTSACIVNTGSKQGITAPPGNLAYNISKGMVKMVRFLLQCYLLSTFD
jgi:NAD(P)-dependent dehydrogenase (short-subunit alcohol dehydrogenase family)